MDVSLIIRLIDQVSQPAEKMRKAIGSIGETAQEIKKGFGDAFREGFSVENIEKATRDAEQAVERSRAKLLGAFAMASSLAAPLFATGRFEEQMRNVGTLVNTAVEDMDAMGRKVLEMSGRLPVELGDLTSALYDVRSAGISAEDAMAVLEGSSRLAVAGLGSTKDAVDLVTSSINAFNLEGEEQERVYDAIFKAVKNGKTTISELSQGFGAVAGTVANANVEFDEYLAAVAALTTTGLPAATAHTQIRAAISGLMGDSKEIKALFKSLGAESFKDLVDKSGGMVAAFEKINEALGGNDEQIKKVLGSVEAYNALIGLTGGQNEAFDKTLEDMRTGANALDLAFQQQSEGFFNQMRMLRNETMGIVSEIGGVLLPIFKDIVAEIKPIVKSISEWVKANPDLTATLVKSAAALLAFNVAARVLSFAVSSVRLPLIGLIGAFLKFDDTGRNVSAGWRMLSGAGGRLNTVLRGIGRYAMRANDRLGGLRNTMRAGIAIGWMIPMAFEILDDLGRTPEERLAQIKANAERYKTFEGNVDQSGFGQWWKRLKDQTNAAMGLESGEVPAEVFRAWVSRGWDKVETFFAETQASMRESATKISADVMAASSKAGSALAAKAGEYLAKAKAQLGEAYESGKALGARLIAGINDFVAEFIQPIRDLFKFALEIEWPEPPAWLKWLMERGSEKLDSAMDWVGDIGSGGGPPAGVTPERSWSFDSIWSSITGASADAGDGLVNGGHRSADAMARGGMDAGEYIRSAARDFQSIVASAKTALNSNRTQASVASEISNSRTGALHGGAY